MILGKRSLGVHTRTRASLPVCSCDGVMVLGFLENVQSECTQGRAFQRHLPREPLGNTGSWKAFTRGARRGVAPARQNSWPGSGHR